MTTLTIKFRYCRKIETEKMSAKCGMKSQASMQIRTKTKYCTNISVKLITNHRASEKVKYLGGQKDGSQQIKPMSIFDQTTVWKANVCHHISAFVLD